MPTKRILITGAGSGIGRAIALATPVEHRLLLLGRRAEPLHEVASKSRALAEWLSFDLGSPEPVDSIRDKLRDMGEGPLALVHNAGTASFGPFEAMEWADIEQMMRVNLLGAMRLTHALMDMLLATRGRVVLVGSVAAQGIFSDSEAYGASKAGLQAFGKCLSQSFRKRGVRVTNVIVGATDTPLWGEGCPPRERMLLPKAVAEAVHYALELPEDRALEELVLTPPDGIL